MTMILSNERPFSDMIETIIHFDCAMFSEKQPKGGISREISRGREPISERSQDLTEKIFPKGSCRDRFPLSCGR